MIRFKSFCLIAANELRIILAVAKLTMIGEKKYVQCGNKIKTYFIKANTPIFNKIPANNTLPVVGASTCASGNHECNGYIGILLLKVKKKDINKNICHSVDNK